MTDIFREVEEDVRRERAAKLWKAYGVYVIALLVLVFAGIAGWQLWQRHDLQERQKAADAFIAAQRISDPRTAASTMSDLSKDAPKGYAEMARLSEAGAMFAAGQRKEAIDLYKQIAADDKGLVGAVARLRAGWAEVDTATRPELTDLLAPINQPGSAWRENAQEILAYADYRALDLKAAQAKFAALANDPEAPDSLRARARAMTAFLKTGGATSYGTVPPDQPALPPQVAEQLRAAQSAAAQTPAQAPKQAPAPAKH